MAQAACGWPQSDLAVESVQDLLSSLPGEVGGMLERGELLVMVNGSELSSVGGPGLKLMDTDEVVLLPIVHGG